MDNRSVELLKASWPIFRIAMDMGNWKEENQEEGHSFLVDQLDLLGEEWKKCGITPGEIASARYALCALLDEAALTKSKFGLNWISHSLVMKYYQDFAAGESFFQKIDELRACGSVVLPLYLMCLVAGFKGRYQFGDKKEFEEYVQKLQQECAPLIGNLRNGEIFVDEPPGKLPRERNGKGWLIAALLIGAVSVSVYIVLMVLAQS